MKMLQKSYPTKNNLKMEFIDFYFNRYPLSD